MRNALLATVAGLGLAAFAYAGSANAQCYWNGYGWYGCSYYPSHRSVSAPFVGAEHPRWGTYGWDYGYSRDYVPYPGARPGPNH